MSPSNRKSPCFGVNLVVSFVKMVLPPKHSSSKWPRGSGHLFEVYKYFSACTVHSCLFFQSKLFQHVPTPSVAFLRYIAVKPQMEDSCGSGLHGMWMYLVFCRGIWYILDWNTILHHVGPSGQTRTRFQCRAWSKALNGCCPYKTYQNLIRGAMEGKSISNV